MSHADGRKSRSRLDDDDHEALEPHADVDDDRDREQRERAVPHAVRTTAPAGSPTLHRMTDQETGAYGPKKRFMQRRDLVAVAAVEGHEDLDADSCR